MKLHSDLEIGAATHTGRQRAANEDDYLLLAPTDDQEIAERGRLFAVADGMGGVVGGAEASRTALRALGSSLLSAPAEQDWQQRMRDGYTAACRKVFELSRQTPALREMGTTLTALNVLGDVAVIGHVGDSRALLVRRGKLRRLTEDHAVREPDNYLTRCIGGGQETEQPDVTSLVLQDGDRLVLLTDGLWSTVPQPVIEKEVQALAPQAAAERLVSLANEAGGPDNSTVIVVQVHSNQGPNGAARSVALPQEEKREPLRLAGAAGRLTGPVWPWLVLALAALLLAAGAARLWLDRDPLGGLLRWLSS